MAKRELSFDEAFQRAKTFSKKYTQKGPYRFFPEPEVVEEVQRGLAHNEVEYGYRYCP